MKERQDMGLHGGGEPSMEADALVSLPAVGPEMLATVPSPSCVANLGVVVRFMGGAYG